MGLFSRKDSSDSKSSRPGARPSVSIEAQAKELRVRARRRLVGALALVLAAIIVVPMLFDPAVQEDDMSAPVVVPSIVPPADDAPIAPGSTTVAQAPDSGSVTESPEAQPEEPAESPAAPVNQPAQQPKPENQAPEPKPEAQPKPAEPPQPKPKPQANRTDDGSVALALLEGRGSSSGSKPAAPAPQKGNFALQIAAYTSEQDALARRDRLHEAGVTNAYVETAQTGGKTTHRLRVGPFPTREAAQAAQTRVRALGYDSGFISSK